MNLSSSAFALGTVVEDTAGVRDSSGLTLMRPTPASASI